MNTCAELFVNSLKAKNMHFQTGVDSDGDTFVEFPYKGKVAKMYFTGEGGKYMSIYVIYERVPEDRLANIIFACNELNARYKWVTFYVDRDNDIILHDDAIMSVENAADEAFELLVRILKISEDVRPEIMKTIYGG